MKIIAKLGEILPKGKDGRPKKGEEKTYPRVGMFPQQTESRFRQVSKNSDKLEKYRAEIEAANENGEPGFSKIA